MTTIESRQELLARLKTLAGQNYSLTEVTPALASEILETCGNKDNRTIQRGHARALAWDMINAEWGDNAMPIAFTADGLLINGHHRLEALVETLAMQPPDGTACKHRLAFDLHQSAFRYTDYHIKPRSIADIMLIQSSMSGQTPVMRSIVEPLTWMARVQNSSKSIKPAIGQIEKLYDRFRDEIYMIERTCSDRAARGRTSAGIKASLILRLYGFRSAPELSAELLRQWKALVKFEVADMDLTTQTLVKRLDTIGADRGSVTALERGAIGWIAWNPSERALKRIALRNIETVLNDVRKAIELALESHC